MSEIYCFSYVEDLPSAEVLKKLVNAENKRAESPRIHFRRGFPRVLGGYGQIKTRAQSLLQMAETGSYTLVLTDLDRAECAPSLIRAWFSIPTRQSAELPLQLCFRVAVREVEAWIMSDREAFARFLRIPVANFPQKPDELGDPKRELLGIIRRKGRTSWHQDMLPRGAAQVGPKYNERVCEFVAEKWTPERASPNSPSLRRAIAAISRVGRA